MDDDAEDLRCQAPKAQASADKEEMEQTTPEPAEPLEEILGNIVDALQSVKGVLANAIENYPMEPELAIAHRPPRSSSGEGST